MTDPEFFWPAGFSPSAAKLYVRNERSMNVSRASVWASLIAAAHWSAWYPNAKHVKLPAAATDLAPGMAFTWSQTGFALVSEIREFEPMRRIAWYAKSPLIEAYHTWDLQGDESTCRVITDETQNGLMPTLFAPIVRPRMRAIHDTWLAGLERRASG